MLLCEDIAEQKLVLGS
jgi:hypothetical protein